MKHFSWIPYMKGKFWVLLFLLSLSICSFAVPAKPGLKHTLTLTDGTTVSATLVGDEYGHYWLGDDGNAYQAVNDDVYQRTDLQIVKQRANVRRSAANQQRTSRLTPRKVGEVGSLTGRKKGLIILVNFSNVTFQSDNNNALYQRIANEKNFSYGKFKGSMYDYFYDQSEGLFELTFDVVGPVTVSKSQAYYGANDSDGNDMHPAEMVIEALKLVDSQVNFANYDWNGDGEVDQVYVVYAGKGEADGGTSSTIWPHEYDLRSANYYGDGEGRQRLDGVWVNTYACGGELNGQTGSIAGIGTMCHEFSHCLGYPDFYDTDYSGGQGMGYWDLMDSGSYNGDGYRPAGFTSYERWMAGWKEPIELTTRQDIVNMSALQNYGSDTYIIYNKGNRNEYYLLENRQKTKWDTDIPGAGLLILHVDYNATVWSRNEPNDDPNHQRLTWIPADNKYQYTIYQGIKYYTEAGAANDPFPYGSVNAFGKNTTPAATLYNKNVDGTYYLDASVENITQNSNGTISFRFAPEVKELTLAATPASGIISYMQEVTLTTSDPNAEIYYTFDGTEPTKDDFLYEPPLRIGGSVTMKAKAFLDGYEDSETLTREYQVKLDIAADCASGTVRAGQTVTLSSTHPEATIYYTTDGTIPNSQSNVYVSPITIDKSVTIKAVAMYEGCLQSDVLTRNYTVPPTTGAYIAKADYSLEGGTVHTQKEWTVTLTKDDAEEGKYWIEGMIPQCIIDWSNTRTNHEGILDSEDMTENTRVNGIATDKVYGYLQEDGNIVIPNHQYVKGYGLDSYYTKNFSSDGDIILNISYDDYTMSIDDAWGITKMNVLSDLLEIDEETEYVRFENMTFRMKTEDDPALKITLDKTELAIAKGQIEVLTATCPSSWTDQSVTWESSDPTIVIVKNGKIKGMKIGTATITCTSNAMGSSATCEVTVGDVKLSKNEVTVQKGETVTLKSKVYPTTLEDQSVTWKSSNTKIATVSNNGKVTGVKTGTAKITCTSNATGLSASCEVTVGYVLLSKNEVSVKKGETIKLKSKVYPTTLEDQSVTWKSSNTKIATVSGNGEVTGVKAGTATITCTSNATGLSATCEVTVGYVKLSKTEVAIEKGKTLTLKSAVYPTTLEDQSVTWTSSDPTIIIVKAGKIKGMKVGTATITCTSNATGLSATCEVTVGYVKLSKSEVTIQKGKTLTLKSVVYPKTVDQSVTWQSSDPTIVKVTASGKIGGLKAGTATITCTSVATGLKATCVVTVTAAATRSLNGVDGEVAGIDETDVDPAAVKPFDVYDLSGRKVLRQATSLDALPKGTYIVNGKKIMK